MRPAPAHIAAFGEHEDPDPFIIHQIMAGLDNTSMKHTQRSKSALLVLLGLIVGYAPAFVVGTSVSGLVLVGILAAVLMVFASWSRSASTSAQIKLANARSQLQMPIKVLVDRDEKVGT
jgi:hypothetical protein